MSIFDVFYILQMVPNRATHHIYLKEAWEVRKFIKKKIRIEISKIQMIWKYEFVSWNIDQWKQY